jgi:phenylacetate-CoA ligase
MERERHPLLTREGAMLLHRLLEHPRAPRWNHACGDRLAAAGLERVLAFEERLRQAAGAPATDGAPPWALEFAERCLLQVPFHRARAGGLRTPQDTATFAALPTCDRGDLNRDFASFVPDDEPLQDLIVYETAGTTGHPVTILSHPLVSNCYLPLLRSALADRGVTLEGGAGRVAMALVCAQSFTYTYASISSYLGGAGFVKVNLNPRDWRDPADRASFLDDCAPAIYSGDPLSFLELMRLPLRHRPQALVSTSMTLASGYARELEGHFGCPVLDLYSLNECRLVAAAADPADAAGRGHRVVPHDVYLEILDAAGRPVPAGRRGEITLTCGRNPFLPLLRYRTGDHARLVRRQGPPLLDGLAGRAPVVFLDEAGRAVNSIDVSYLLKPFPLARYALRQMADRSLKLSVQGPAADRRLMRTVLAKLFGDLPLEVELLASFAPGSGKPVPFTTDLPDAWREAEPGYRTFTFHELMHPDSRRGCG